MLALCNKSKYSFLPSAILFFISLLIIHTGFSQTTAWVRNNSTNPLKQFAVASGRQSHPVFVDIDGDGDLDCFSGEFNWNKNKIVSSHISFYRNEGDARHPLFKEMKGEQNPLSGVAVPGLLIPRFADIDGDGDEDCFVAGDRGSITFYENKGNARQAMFEKQSAAFNPLSQVKASGNTISQFLLADADKDGDIDCLLTDEDGTAFYYQNKGSHVIAKFSAEDENNNPFAFISKTPDSNISFYDWSKDGSADLFVNAVGYVNQHGRFTKADGISVPQNEDAIASGWVDINGDGNAEIISGTADGKFVYNTLAVANEKAVLSVAVYPNPTTQNFTVYFPSPAEKRMVQVVSESGKVISAQTISSNHYTFGDSFTPGVYFVQVYSLDKKIAEQKIVKL